MELLVIRHGIAEEKDAFAAQGKDDAERPLTVEGRRKMRTAARGLKTRVPTLDLLASSPLVRARQTADIVARAYGGMAVTEIDQLKPDQSPEAFATWLKGQAARTVVAAVGHEPLLGHIVSHLVARRANSFIELKKGGACLVAFPEKVEAGAGLLRWALTPGQLRDLRD
jgi:phosphohistidine phosphatase